MLNLSKKTWIKTCPKCRLFLVKKNGKKRGKQSYKCQNCHYRWTIKGNHRKNYLKAYKHWLLGRRTLAEICDDLDVSYPKLNKEFDRFDMSEGLLEEALQDLNQPISVIIDATFFKGELGFLVFHDFQKVTTFQV